jgi:Rrf2 family protein
MRISIYKIGAMISRTAEYAVRAMVALKMHGAQSRLRAEQVSDLTGIPTNYLSKILHALARAGLVTGQRGRHGGFALAERRRPITAFDIVDQFDQISSRRRCLLGNAECSARTACTAHSEWDAVWTTYEQFLRSQTVDRLASPPSRARPQRKTKSRRKTNHG